MNLNPGFSFFLVLKYVLGFFAYIITKIVTSGTGNPWEREMGVGLGYDPERT